MGYNVADPLGIPVDAKVALRRTLGDYSTYAIDYGVKADGVSDDFLSLQAAIDATPAYGTLRLPPGQIRCTDTPVINKSMTLEGVGVRTLNQSLNVLMAFDTPTVSPWLGGTVLVQETAGKNGLNVTVAAKSVNLRGFGIRFSDAIRHVNTGHGIYCVPSTMYGSGHDHGIMQSNWEHLQVFGHDGNHYAYYFINAIHYKLDDLRSYGGGGFYTECDSYAGNYGNLVATSLFSALYCGGTAYGYRFKGRSTGANGYLNLIVLLRPQLVMVSKTALFPETTTPDTTGTSAQFGFHAQDKVGNLCVIQPDFEPAGTPRVLFADGPRSITPDGYYGRLDNTDFILALAPNGGHTHYSDHSFRGRGKALSALTAGAQAGAGAPAPIGANQGDMGGSISFGTGSSPSAGEMVRVAFSTVRGTNYRPLISPANAATAALGLYVTKDTGGISVCAANPPASGQADTTYAFEYTCVYYS